MEIIKALYTLFIFTLWENWYYLALISLLSYGIFQYLLDYYVNYNRKSLTSSIATSAIIAGNTFTIVIISSLILAYHIIEKQIIFGLHIALLLGFIQGILFLLVNTFKFESRKVFPQHVVLPIMKGNILIVIIFSWFFLGEFASVTPSNFVGFFLIGFSIYLFKDFGKNNETSEKLERFPDEVKYPEDLNIKIRYDNCKQLLIYAGIMSEEEKNKLLSLSTDDPYKKAIEALFSRFRNNNARQTIDKNSTAFSKCVIFLILATIISASISLLAKYAADPFNLNIFLFMLFSNFFSCFVALYVIYSGKNKSAVNKQTNLNPDIIRAFKKGLWLGLLNFASYACLLKALSQDDASVIIPIFSLYIVIPILLSTIFQSVKLTEKATVAVVLSILAIIILKY